MRLFEFIVQFIFEEFLRETIISINNFILKLRGIETRSIEEIKLDKLRKKYEYKTVKLKNNVNDLEIGEQGTVLEVINLNYCFVEFGKEEKEIKEINLKDLLISDYKSIETYEKNRKS